MAVQSATRAEAQKQNDVSGRRLRAAALRAPSTSVGFAVSTSQGPEPTQEVVLRTWILPTTNIMKVHITCDKNLSLGFISGAATRHEIGLIGCGAAVRQMIYTGPTWSERRLLGPLSHTKTFTSSTRQTGLRSCRAAAAAQQDAVAGIKTTCLFLDPATRLS